MTPKKYLANGEPRLFASSLSAALKCPMIKMKNESSAESAGDENRDGGQDRQLEEDQENGAPDRERQPSAADVEQRERNADAHYQNVDQQRQTQAEIFSENKIGAADGL